MDRNEAGSGERQVQGRPRDTRIDTAVLAATVAVLDEVGYARLTLTDVARRAGSTTPALYRRWPDKARLVLAALATRLPAPQPPDTGCTLCDLSEAIEVFAAAFRRIPPGLPGALLADTAADPALHAMFTATLFDPPRDAVAATLDRAVARGDLRADVDRGLLLDLLGSLVHHRMLFGHAPLDPAAVAQAVAVVLGGAARDYPDLLAHAAQFDRDPAHAGHIAHPP